MGIKKKINQSLIREHLQDKKFLLAVSGGVDSMVLLDCFYRLGYDIEVAHVNYGFRPEADQEQSLVEKHCKDRNIPFHLLRLDGYQGLKEHEENNLQAYARQKRYHFFSELLQKGRLDIIVTAHHANDNVETVLFNFFKGSGYKGIGGMKKLQGHIFRPFLDIFRDEIEGYAHQHQVSYAMDSSNFQSTYTRNFIRNEVIPLLANRFPNLVRNIAGNMERTREINDYYHTFLTARKNLVIRKDGRSTIIDIPRLNREKYANDLKLMLLDEYGFGAAQLGEFNKLINARNSAQMSNERFTWIKSHQSVIVDDKDTDHGEVFVIHNVDLNDGLHIKIKSTRYAFQIENGEHNSHVFKEGSLVFDLEKIEFPVLIRKVQPGDYFYPLGLNKKKKVRKFLLDEKIPVHLREDTYILVAGDKVLGVMEHRIDHRVRVTRLTRKVLKIEKQET